MMRRTRYFIPAVVMAIIVSACGSDSEQAGGEELSGELNVFAAASLTDAFDELASQFAEEHPEVTYIPNYASSSTLATQINEGAPADVFASANEAQMEVVQDTDAVDEPTFFARNVLELVVESGNPHDITSIEDLARDDLTVVRAGDDVPAGAATITMLENAGLEINPSSLEVDVRATLARIELGEADVAVVYRSDVATADDSVEGVEIPEEDNVEVDYPIAAIGDSGNPDAAEAWITFVLEEGSDVLEEYGLIPQ